MKIYSVAETATELKISQPRVRQLLAEGRIKGKKVSGVWLVTSLKYKRLGAWEAKKKEAGIGNEKTVK